MDLSVYAPAFTSHSKNLITAHRTSAEERVLTEDLNICLKNIIHTLEKKIFKPRKVRTNCLVCSIVSNELKSSFNCGVSSIKRKFVDNTDFKTGSAV